MVNALVIPANHIPVLWDGEAPAEPKPVRKARLGGSLALPFAKHAIALLGDCLTFTFSCHNSMA